MRVSPGLTLELTELLGGPGGQRLGLCGLGAPSLRQQVVDERTDLHQLHHVFTEGGAQVAEQAHAQEKGQTSISRTRTFFWFGLRC